MASNAAVPFWRSAGMTYISYSNICANLVRNCLKEPHRTEALTRENVHFSVSKWEDGKPQKPSVFNNEKLLWVRLDLRIGSICGCIFCQNADPAAAIKQLMKRGFRVLLKETRKPRK